MNRRCLCIVVAALYLLLRAPLTAEWQQAKGAYRIGYLSAGSAAWGSIPRWRETQLQLCRQRPDRDPGCYRFWLRDSACV